MIFKKKKGWKFDAKPTGVDKKSEAVSNRRNYMKTSIDSYIVELLNIK